MPRVLCPPATTSRRPASWVRPAATGRLSWRSQAALKPLSSYFPAFAKAMERPWTAADPGGNIVMLVAENRLLSGQFMERLRRCAPPEQLDLLYYSDFRGTLPLREAVSNFMTRRITTADHPVLPEHLALGNGCGTVIDHLFHCLCDPGDGVIVPAPLYPTFLNDLQVSHTQTASPHAQTVRHERAMTTNREPLYPCARRSGARPSQSSCKPTPTATISRPPRSSRRRQSRRPRAAPHLGRCC